ncbi:MULTISPECIES: hypothetical protein [unclassified Mesorhizobium]|uniref:hypothetical protein n=1 Tax=unclassified Mesorhizobium TaxID=325217 RepID=UPI000FCAB387|nr:MULTISPECIES: hypothetical protein [unclassified Mesorhizobium]TGP22320.1 hypothetical protein EN874_019605 [Mesorhizobium sp. M1D.F.Ca.ET.231.01.1.1]TGP24710.1 hypothetical protein EN877_30590 [Mesorhizobium sp. M1D.F.Ca.ET.234.01.1.1]TGR60333.1 hypothetical protein EN835_033180 [Mesorhizobium sp. M1C.F.Ca.ET.192.01.1.1]TGS37313.1 hypothetical protein EN827_30895 [Mesorhizobium sp. M1D.F.Ca.ET.184.01.1.1]TGS58113.1 hypothetical protein EN826_030870 [Mesorhizobium sp. M1D.F.Ca.ET.183.01.1.1
MTGPLSNASRQLEELVDVTADWATDLLRRTAAEMSHALDREAMQDVEGAEEWRKPTAGRSFQS